MPTISCNAFAIYHLSHYFAIMLLKIGYKLCTIGCDNVGLNNTPVRHASHSQIYVFSYENHFSAKHVGLVRVFIHLLLPTKFN